MDFTAGMAELVDAPDSKSGGGNIVWVQFPLPAHLKKTICFFQIHQFICYDAKYLVLRKAFLQT